MIKRLIFDIDGTLITGVSFNEAIEKSLIEYGIYSKENMEKFLKAISTYEKNYTGYEAKQYVEYFSSVLGCKLGEDFLDIFFKNLRKYAIPSYSKNVEETIKKLASKYELVLLSNYFEKSQRGRLENIHINQYFSEYYGEKRSKPNKQVYIDCIGKHKPEECVMIGDDIELDIKEAMKNGINTIFIDKQERGQGNVETILVKSVTEINEGLINCLNIDCYSR